MISSYQNPKIKLLRTLAGRPKERHEANAFLAEGVRLGRRSFAANWPFQFVLYSDELSERGKELIEKLEDKKIDVEKVEGRLLQSLSETETSQGIIAVLKDFQLPIPQSPNFVFIPDSIRDPGNLGTLLRTADAAGVQAVLIPPETTDAFAPKVLRAGMGAHFRLPIQTMRWDEIREYVSAAHLDSPPVFDHLPQIRFGFGGGRRGWVKYFSCRHERSILLGNGFPSAAGIDCRRRSRRCERAGTQIGKCFCENSYGR